MFNVKYEVREEEEKCWLETEHWQTIKYSGFISFHSLSWIFMTLGCIVTIHRGNSL